MRSQVTAAKAGKQLRAKVAFVHLGSKRRVTDGSVRCRALLDGRRLRVVQNAFVKGYATCAWEVPSRAQGSTLTGIVAVQIDGEAVRRVFTRRIG